MDLVADQRDLAAFVVQADAFANAHARRARADHQIIAFNHVSFR